MLSVWLPLTKDLRNQGLLSGMTVTGTAVYNATGSPIGNGCYTFTTAQSITIQNVPFASLTNATVSFWMRITTMKNIVVFTSRGSSDGAPYEYIFAANSNGTSNIYDSTGTQDTMATHKAIYVDSVVGTKLKTDGLWHHYCMTGICVSGWTGNSFKINGYNGGFNVDGGISDVRIYDHELKADEVRELYLHEIFSVNGLNFLPSKINYASEWNRETAVNWSTYGLSNFNCQKEYVTSVSPAISFVVNNKETNVLKITQTGTTSSPTLTCACRSTTMPISQPGERIQASCYVKAGTDSAIGKSCKLRVFRYVSSGTSTYSVIDSPSIVLSDKWQRLATDWYNNKSYPSQSAIYYYIGPTLLNGEVVYASNFQIESGSTLTPYVESTINSYAEDTSGMLNRITTTNGSVARSGNTLYFDGVSSIQFSGDFMKIVDSAYTVSLWVYSKEADSARAVFMGGGNQGNGWTFNLEKLNGSNRFRVYNNQKPDWINANCVITANTWIHVVVTFTNNVCTMYKNGVNVGTNSTFSAHTSYDTTYYVGGDYRAGDTMYTGHIGNLRIFANAMTADEVLKLYNEEKQRYS